MIVTPPTVGLDPGGPGPPPPPPNPENQFENGAKFLCLKGKGRIISLFLHQKCLNVNSSGHKEPQNRNFLTISCLLMSIVMIVSLCPRCPNLVVGLKASVALKIFSHANARISGTPLFQILDPPLPYSMNIHACGIYIAVLRVCVYVQYLLFILSPNILYHDYPKQCTFWNATPQISYGCT